jgi:peptidoglycan/LPS O-acetylase OafA/YrhL
MKDRLPALDGLRGFAAMSVVLGHVAIWNLGGNSPIITTILIALSAAHNAVQILFVLSGFLMAFLYPSTPNAVQFIKKRYARIFPIYGVVVIFLWILSIRIFPWYLQLSILLLLALIINFSWKLLNKYSRLKNIGSTVFFLFVILQISVLVFNLFFTQHLIVASFMNLPPSQFNLLSMFTNLTLTTQLVRGIPASSGVFWSLGAEILFYISYPFIVVPIVQLAKKHGTIISLLIIIAITKILFNLDNAFSSIASLAGMNIARTSGFVAGVTIGAIYQSQGRVWNSIKNIVSHRIFGIFAILLLILVQLGEHIVGAGSIGFMNNFYLITSWLIAIVVLNAIIPNSLIHKIFSVKIFTFIGLISYSLYLIHSQVAPWQNDIRTLLLPFIESQKVMQIIVLLIYLLLLLGISYFLFKTVEYLYFAGKKKVIATTQANYKEIVKEKYRGFSPKRYVFIISSTIIILSFIYTGMYSPKLLISRHSFKYTNLPNNSEVSLLSRSVEIPFISDENNLSVVGFDMRYGGSAGLVRNNDNNPSVLKFELLDKQNHQIFTSVRHAYEVEGSPRFQFGFPTISDSKGKGYMVRLSLAGGKANDSILLNTTKTGFLTISTINKTDFARNLLNLFMNRLIYVVTNPDYIFSILFILALIFLSQINKKTYSSI